jgi:hypothetical protein
MYHILSKETEKLKNLTEWWESLTIEDKRNLSCFGNTIQFRKVIPGFGNARSRYQSIKEYCSTCDEEMKKLGFLERDYVKTKDRSALRDKNFIKGRKLNRARLKFLTELTLESVEDLIPITDETEPYVQLKHLFGSQMSTVYSPSGRENYKVAFNHLSDYLQI